MERFSLRRVAKRANVSHAAPAHHFGDVGGLLTALAAAGFEALVAAQTARQTHGSGAEDALVAAGLGYVDFALARPALFRLMFASGRPNHADPVLQTAAGAAYSRLCDGVARVVAERTRGARDATGVDVIAAWSVAHGVADLLVAGHGAALMALPDGERDAAIAAIVRRAIRVDAPAAGVASDTPRGQETDAGP